MQSSDSLLQMLGLLKYSSAFKGQGLTSVSSVISNEEVACGLLRTKREKDILQGYLRVRENRKSDDADLAERRAATFQMVRETLRQLANLQDRKAKCVREGTREDVDDLLDAIDDAKQSLRLGQQQLEELTREGQSAASATRMESMASRSSNRRTSLPENGGKSPRIVNETDGTRPPTVKARPFTGSARGAIPVVSSASGRMDPNNWNRNAPVSRVERLTRQYGSSARPTYVAPLSGGTDLGLCVVGSKAVRVEKPLSASAQMRYGASFGPIL